MKTITMASPICSHGQQLTLGHFPPVNLQHGLLRAKNARFPFLLLEKLCQKQDQELDKLFKANSILDLTETK